MEKFTLYCGAFAATRLFVEFAIPTALVLSTDKLKFTSDTPWESGVMWRPHYETFAQQYGYNLSELMKNYPAQKLFLHPIKLSKWS